MQSKAFLEYAARRRRLSLSLTGLMLAVYFGFILLGAFAKDWMGNLVIAGLSWGILLGALVIVCAFLLTALYVRLMNVEERRESGLFGYRAE